MGVEISSGAVQTILDNLDNPIVNIAAVYLIVRWLVRNSPRSSRAQNGIPLKLQNLENGQQTICNRLDSHAKDIRELRDLMLDVVRSK